MSALFSKVVKLSMKSITVTNSGKLISLISADLFLIEKGLAVFPIMFAAPFINIVAGFLLTDIIGLYYTLLAFAFWIVTILMQFVTSSMLRQYKG